MDNIFYKILPSGIRIVHRLTASPVAYVGIMVGAGTRDEQPKENGMAHYIEHCVFKGCETGVGAKGQPSRTVNARQIIERVEGVGGEINAYTTKEETVFYAATPKQYFARTLSLIANMVFRPTFPKTETDKEIGVILDEIESYNDSPSELIYDDFENLVFAGNSLSQRILGTKRTLKYISRSPLLPLEWMRKHYHLSNMVIFSQGCVPFATVVKTVEKILDGVEDAQTESLCCRELPPRMLTDTMTYKKHAHQAHVMMGGRAYALGHTNQLGLYLLNNILGGGSMSSRLNMSLRERRGLVYTIESTYTPMSDTGYWCLYFASDPQHREQCEDLCRKELLRLRDERLSTAQWQRALNQLRGQMAISAENQENNALTMAKQMLYYGRSSNWEDTFARVTKITPSQLQEIADEMFSAENICILRYE